MIAYYPRYIETLAPEEQKSKTKFFVYAIVIGVKNFKVSQNITIQVHLYI